MQNKRDNNVANKQLKLLQIDMLYNILSNMNLYNIKIDTLAEKIGISNELFIKYLTQEIEDFTIYYTILKKLDENNTFENHSKTKTPK